MAHQYWTATGLLVLMVTVATVSSLPLSAPISDTGTCNTTSVVGQTRRGCSSKIINKIKDAQDCAAQCCAIKPSSPFSKDGCDAWFINDYNQCFLCIGPNAPPDPKPASKATGCNVGAKEKTNCTTGLVTPPPPPPLPPAPKTGPLGGEASLEYVNYARSLRWPSYINGSGSLNRTTEMDAKGWPLIDCSICIFDDRPVGAWAPPMDDPEQRQRDFSGDWTLTMTGQADISLGDPSIKGISLGKPSYDETTNTMTQTITFAKGKYPEVVNLLVLKFNNTKANSTAPTNTGFKDLQVTKPGYTGKKRTQMFSDNWAQLLKVFDHHRWMGTTGTNSYSWLCGGDNAVGCSVIEWEDRNLPDYAFTDKRLCKGCHGIPWEHVLLAANELERDIWINVPVSASAPTFCQTAPTTAGGDPHKCLNSDPKQSYEYQMALFFKNGNNYTGNVGLKEHLNIYIEHSNEVWNFGFPQYALNVAAAQWEVQNTSKSNLADEVPGRPDLSRECNATDPKHNQCWGHRRHARRVHEIAMTFSEVFGADSLLKRIRPIYASWTINEQEYYNNTLAWLESQYGPVNKYLYGMAAAQYFGPHAQDAHGKMQKFNYSTATIPEVIQAFHDGADANVEMTYNFVQFAKSKGIKTAGYESGPGYAVGALKPGSKGLNTLIEASRDKGMKDVIEYDVQQTCWRHGWNIYNYFAIEGAVSRYGCWGATEDWADINPGPPKLQAIYELTGHSPGELKKWAQNESRPRARTSGKLL